MTSTPTPSPSSLAADPRRPKSAQQTVSVNIADDSEASQNSSRRFQLEVSECVETKTITTTTRLTRKFPHVFVRDPTPLENLDSREYPLAMKPTPPELSEFSYIMDDEDAENQYDQDAQGHAQADADADGLPLTRSHQKAKQISSGRLTPSAKAESPSHDSATPARLIRRGTHSPSEPYPRRSRQLRTGHFEPPSAPASASASQSSQRLVRSSNLHAVSDKLRRSIAHGTGGGSSASAINGNTARRDAGGRVTRAASSFLATPDTSEGAIAPPQRASRRRSLHLDGLQNSPDSASNMPQPAPRDTASPVDSDSHTIFGGSVATPPITDADPEPFADGDDSLPPSNRQFHARPTIDIGAAQDASLPSPRLSPTLAAAQLQTIEHDDDGHSSLQTGTADNSFSWMDKSQDTVDSGASMEMVPAAYHSDDSRALMRPNAVTGKPVVVDTQTLLEAFDSMKTEMKTFMMYQFLRRCPRPTLRVIADAVNPAFKCDFLQKLPLELGYQVLSYLDHRDLCRAAQVSKQWRNMVDRNETGWKELFDRDGFHLSSGELSKAIAQGWGWQDPANSPGFERDLSMHSRLTSSEHELTRSYGQGSAPPLRTSKRKRALTAYSASERSKRRAGTQEAGLSRNDAAHTEVRQHKSEGPLSAANLAAAAVPDPQLGLASLRELHLFKSLYRRHYMIRHSWTSGDVKPGHVAFAAHPRHVITSLQFDEDKIITGSDDTMIHIYDTKTGKLRKKLEGHEGGVWALQYEGNILVSGATDRSVRVWDIERGLCQQVFYGHTSTVRCLQILMPTEVRKDASGKSIMQPEKPLIITGSRDSQLRIWRLPEVGSRRYTRNGQPSPDYDCPYFIRTLNGHTSSVRAVSAHGDTLVSGSYDSTIRVWRISTGESVHVLQGHSQRVYSVVLDHERNRCISGSMDSLAKIWDLATGACLYTLEGHSSLVGLLDLRDDRLVSAAADSTLRIWDPKNGKCKSTLTAHTGAITCFQHDGQKVISGSEKTVKMWDVKKGECVRDLLSDLSGVWQVKFDARRCVAAVQRDGVTYIEILDFGAVRDGEPPERLGNRILLNEDEVRRILEEGV